MPNHPASKRPTVTKWLMGIILALALGALAIWLFPISRGWSLGFGAGSLGLFTGLGFSAIDQRQPDHGCSIDLAPVLVLVGAAITARFIAHSYWWAILCFVVSLITTIRTMEIYDRYTLPLGSDPLVSRNPAKDGFPAIPD